MRNTLIATIVSGSLLSFNAHAIDLLQVYREALANDAVYASARASLAAGSERSTQGLAPLLPQVGVSVGYGRVDVAAFPTTSSNTRRIALSQPLFNWASWEQYQRSKLLVTVSEMQFAQAQQDLIVRVSQAYFDVLAAQDTLASVKAQKEAITEQLASAKRNFEVGTATITDSHEAQARFDLAVAQELAAESDLLIKRTALEQIIGRPIEELARLRPGVKISAPVPAQIEKWVEGAEQQNLGVLVQQLSQQIARRDIKVARAGHLPTVGLEVARAYSSRTTAANPSGYSNSVGVQLNIPVFSGFAVNSRVREAIALEEKARADLENARRTAIQNARQSYLGVNSGLAQVRALEAAEVSSQSALEANRLGYQVGVRINIDVLNAQQQLFVTRRDLARARYDALVNGLRLQAAAGILKEEDVVELNGMLQH